VKATLLTFPRSTVEAWLAVLGLFCVHYLAFILSIVGIDGGVKFVQVLICLMAGLVSLRIKFDLFLNPVGFLMLMFFTYAAFNGYFLGDHDFPYAERKFMSIFYINIAEFVFLAFLLKDRITIVKSILFFELSLVPLLLFIFITPQFSGDRLTILSLNPIWFARLIGVLIILTINRLTSHFSYRNLRFGLWISLLVFTQYLTGSKGPMLATFFCSIILMTFKGVYKGVISKYFLYKSFAVLGLFFSGVLVYFFQFSSSEFLVSAYYRKEMVLSIFESNLVSAWGIGLGNFFYLGGYALNFYYPHNILLEVFIELGVVGFSLLSVLFVYFFYFHSPLQFRRKNNYVDDDYLLLWSLTTYFFLNSMFSGDLNDGNIFLFAFILISVRYFHVSK
jgi:hypothetical protein